MKLCTLRQLFLVQGFFVLVDKVSSLERTEYLRSLLLKNIQPLYDKNENLVVEVSSLEKKYVDLERQVNDLQTAIKNTNPFNPAIVPLGWEGGFAQSNINFAYPAVDLSSIDVTTNMANIDKLTRMQNVKWPEFSWEMVPGNEGTRVFNTFEEYLTRLGYDNEGRVWSIICPQQGIHGYINFNIEISVTGVRGWEDETARSTGVDMSVTGVVWLTVNKEAPATFRFLLNLIKWSTGMTGLPFSKSNGIQILTNRPGTEESLLILHDGMDPDFNAPHFKTHWDEGAYAQVYVQAQLGEIAKRAGQSQLVTGFNELIVTMFNFASGNMLQSGNVLSWNIWFESPEIVNQTEWQQHAEHWRDSFDNGNSHPGEPSTYFNGTIAKPETNPEKLISKFIADYFTNKQINSQVNSMNMDESFSEIEEEEVKDNLRRHRLL